MLYFIIYYSQIDNNNEKINQIMKIIMRFYIHILEKKFIWSKILSHFQAFLNNFVFVIIKKTFNEIIYEFISNMILNLLNIINALDSLYIKIFAKNAIVFVNINVKYYYDRYHQSMFFKVDDYAFLCLHKRYNILINFGIIKKLS